MDDERKAIMRLQASEMGQELSADELSALSDAVAVTDAWATSARSSMYRNAYASFLMGAATAHMEAIGETRELVTFSKETIVSMLGKIKKHQPGGLH